MTGKSLVRRYARWDEAFEKFVTERQIQIREVENYISEYNVVRDLLDDPEYKGMRIELQLKPNGPQVDFHIRSIPDYDYAYDYVKRLAAALHNRKMRPATELPEYSISGYGFYGEYAFRTNLTRKSGAGKIEVHFNFPTLGIPDLIEFKSVEKTIEYFEHQHHFLQESRNPLPPKRVPADEIQISF
jgi:hypothetical protein